MRWTYYNFRELGVIKYIPVFIMIGMTVLCRKSTAEAEIILKSFELFLPPLVSLWIIPLFYNYVSEGARELYLSYPCAREKTGAFRVLIFAGIYAVLLNLAFYLAVPGWRGFLVYILIFAVQSFLYASAGFLLIVLTKNTVVSMGIILAYAGIQVLDNGRVFSAVSVCFYDMISEGIPVIAFKLIMELVIGTVLLLAAQRHFEKMEVI